MFLRTHLGMSPLPTSSPFDPGLTSEGDAASSTSSSSTVKLIAGGRTLADDSKSLSSYNITPNSRVLVSGGAAAQHNVSGQEAAQRSEEARLAHLEKLKSAVGKLASRGDGRGLTGVLRYQRGSRREGQAGWLLDAYMS